VVELLVEVVASPVREGVVEEVGFVVLQSHDEPAEMKWLKNEKVENRRSKKGQK
jgi:hypothetical protein